MKLTKFEDKSILLRPQTAMEEHFLSHLAVIVEAKEKELIREHSSIIQSLSQSPSPLREVSQS